MNENTNQPSFLFPSVKNNPLLYAGFLVIAAFIFLRIWRLGIPAEVVFDEVYYPKYAQQYIAGQFFFDVHPPLGKLIIALGELLIGDKAGTNPIGWRIMPLLFGIGLIPASYWAAKKNL